MRETVGKYALEFSGGLEPAVSERDSSQFPSAQKQEALAGSCGDAFGINVENLQRYLRMAQELTLGSAVAWLRLTTTEESCGYSLGIEHYTRDVSTGPWGDLSSDWIVTSARRAKQAWPDHPLTRALSESGSLVARVVKADDSERWVLCVVSSQPELSEKKRAAFEDLANSLSAQVGATATKSRTAVPDATLDVASLSSDEAEQNWLIRQLAQIEPARLLFVFDHEQTVRLVDGLVESCDMCREPEKLIGQRVSEIPLFASGAPVVDACVRALVGDDNVLFHSSLGRQLVVRTTPLRNLEGKIVFGVCLVRDVTEEVMRDGLERLLSARLRTLVDSMDSGILVEDENNVIQHVNQHFCDLMNIEALPQSLIGQASSDMIERISSVFFIPEALAEGIVELKAAVRVVKDELVYLADMRILERSYSPLQLDGQSVGHLWSYRDVTDRERNKDLLQRQADELRALSLVDELTGLYNRRGFLTLATQQLKLCDRSLRAALIVFVDLDGMKRINDELGHEYGDQALVETASVLRQCFRYSDVVARLGGDEFVVLAVEADPPIAELVVERLYEKLAEMNAKAERKFELKFSVGVADYDPSKFEMVEEVLARADNLMYEQKRLRKQERKD